ncbi:YhcN/YlaJ family sporulation lipoprotein [Aquibacillus sp. 3ASR75-11]|uniref:YhcN/YlaJ family sporulation lipoprotein n=1 Tax=Terrihalobacillus insolitus TaxID=2950438 RepID=A0A9X3WRC4_9BACI|nr:YhcN/YlaJ family sporulation lipoprotein [Terrihalobacillus insolitus]MDC3413596.1 YhcN/YlaJ family sporulation lipoprotein [Terrihalobacillus insolitus]MDC3424647.1 YhcN/YlaJ family sporulation lipoprotein [Terrihalobacillus insolitus]
MMWKTIGLTIAASLTLIGCQNADEIGQGGNDLNDNVEQARFNGTTDFPGDDNNQQRGLTDNQQNNQGHMQDRNGTNGNNIGNGRNGNNIGNGTNTGNNTGNQMNQDQRQGQGQNQGNQQYDVSDRAAERITQNVKGVDNAYVLTTENNAYVAAEMDADAQQNNTGQNNDVSDKIKSQITDAVKAVDNDIDNVYVSTNPDFVNLTNNYVNDVDNGNPVEGFFQQFGDMVERIFPETE